MSISPADTTSFWFSLGATHARLHPVRHDIGLRRARREYGEDDWGVSSTTPADEFRQFLDIIEDSVSTKLDTHPVLDNLSTHKAPTACRSPKLRPPWNH
jgi:hypothetical protein